MHVRNLTLIVMAMSLGSAAVAAPGYTASLAQPLAVKKEVIVDRNIFRCDGSTCILTSHPIDADSLHSCRALERQVGTLTAYVVDGKPFDAEKLAKCNAQ